MKQYKVHQILICLYRVCGHDGYDIEDWSYNIYLSTLGPNWLSVLTRPHRRLCVLDVENSQGQKVSKSRLTYSRYRGWQILARFTIGSERGTESQTKLWHCVSPWKAGQIECLRCPYCNCRTNQARSSHHTCHRDGHELGLLMGKVRLGC